MTKTITLYRGDSDKIRNFETKKSNSFCLLGKGIYLTNRLSIAKTYMDKGSVEYNCFDLFQGTATNRLEAYEKAFKEFLRIQLRNHPMYLRKMDEKSKAYLNLVAEARNHYNNLIDEGSIKADYDVPRFRDSPRTITVAYTPDEVIGYVTKFEFPEFEFNTSVFKVDGTIRDEFFWELMWDNKVEFGTQHDSKDTYIKMNSNGHSIPPFIPAVSLKRMSGLRLHSQNHNWKDVKALMAAKRLLIPYGYKGFEYEGGRYVGGAGRHRAFSMWDDEYINDHKIERFKP